MIKPESLKLVMLIDKPANFVGLTCLITVDENRSERLLFRDEIFYY